MRCNRRQFLGFSASATLGAAASGCAWIGSGRAKPNVLWIVNDASRAQNYSCYGYERETSPFIDSLAKRGALFERTYAAGYTTNSSVSLYMTGQYFPDKAQPLTPLTDIPLRAPDYSAAAPSLFRAHGYRTRMVTANTGWVPVDSQLGRLFETAVMPGKSAFIGSSGEVVAKRTFRDMNDGAIRWLLEPSEKPFFLYMHAVDTHAPYAVAPEAMPPDWVDPKYTSEFIQDFVVTFPSDVQMRVAPSDRDHLTGLYDSCILSADAGVRGLLGFLERQEMLDNTIVIYSSDHGELLLDDLRAHGHPADYGCSDEQLWIPLIMAGPGVPPGRSIGGVTQAVDILPTLLELCGIESEAASDGHSLVPYFEREGEISLNNAVSFAGSADTGFQHITVTSTNLQYDWRADEGPEGVWRVPNRAAEPRVIVPDRASGLEDLRSLVLDDLLARASAAREIFAPRAFVAGFGKGSISYWLVETGQVIVHHRKPKEPKQTLPRGQWIIVRARASHRDHLLLLQHEEGEPVPELRMDLDISPEVFPYPRARLWIEVRHPEPTEGAAVAEVSLYGSDFRPLVASDAGEDWSFVEIGTFEAEGSCVLVLRPGSQAPVRVRRVLVCPELPGAEGIVAQLSDTGSLARAAERDEALEALGYIQ